MPDQTTQFCPKIAFLVILGQALLAHLVPCWWVGWWLWRAGCISQDTYLLYDNDNNNENIIRDGGSTVLFAANTVDTEEEEQIHLNEIVSIKCLALILGTFIHFFGANFPVAKVACLILILCPLL